MGRFTEHTDVGVQKKDVWDNDESYDLNYLCNTMNLQERFDYFNRVIFNGALPQIPITVSNAKRFMGQFSHPTRGKDLKRCRISISVRFDVTDTETEDTLIHEMIHFYIWYKDIKDSSTHGQVFLSMMDEINRKFCRKLSVSHRMTKSELDSDTHVKNHYIAMTQWSDGIWRITLCARTRIFELHRLFSGSSKVTKIKWYWSCDPWFNRFPISRTAKGYAISEADIKEHVGNATPCVCDGRTFQPARTAFPGK